MEFGVMGRSEEDFRFHLRECKYRIILSLLSCKILGVVGSATNRIVLSLLSCSYCLYRVDS